ncbi:MAG: sensor histidine kinase [Anaerolineales bacterium]
MRNYAPYLIYLAVLARTAGWSEDSFPVPLPVWILLSVFGLLLVTEPVISHRVQGYPRLYALAQSGLVIVMLYLAPTMDILTMLFFPLSFQVVQYFHERIGFIWIGVFSLAMAGTFFFGMELGPGILMILLGTGMNLLIGSYASLIRRTDSSRLENQRMFDELQGAYRRLKDSAAQQEQLAAEQERHRLVRELHDSLTQTLFSMNLAVQAAQLSAEKGASLNRLQELARSAAGEVQTLVGAYPARAPAADELVPALRQLVEERRARDRLEISLEVSGRKALPGLVAVNLFRITQEALNNVSRHAGECRVFVRLNLAALPVCLEVEDTGVGFDLNAQDRSHRFGLTGMEGRAREMDWDLKIDSQPGRGTRIRVQEKAA